MIFYFSATGNGLDLSNRLAEGLDDRKADIAAELKGDCTYHLEDGERVGIVAPVHFYGLPMIIEEFISRMRFDRTPYLYLVLSYGSEPGQAMARAERCLSEHGHILNAKLTVAMPENYVLMFDVPSESEIRTMLTSAYGRLDQFVSAVKAGGAVDMSEPPTFKQRLTGLIARPMYDHGRGTGRFYVDRTCTGCGRCSRICPSQAIEMIDRIPTWTKKKCLRCTACINRCPFKALQFGRSTSKRGRYVNPNVTFDE